MKGNVFFLVKLRLLKCINFYMKILFVTWKVFLVLVFVLVIVKEYCKKKNNILYLVIVFLKYS